MLMKVVIDGGSENRKQLKQYYKEIGIKWVVINIYNLTANGVVKVGYMSITNMFSKLIGGIGTNWLKYLLIVIFVDQISIHSFYKRISFELMYGHEILLLIEIEISIWCILEWDEVEMKEDLVLL